MVQMGVRDYDPVTGRFAAVDPLHGSMYKPQSRNRYEYAYNNPLVYQDLNGRFPDLIGGAQDFATEAYNANVDALTGAYYMTTHPGETADMWLEGAGIAKEHWEDVPEATFDMAVGDPLGVMFGSDSTLYQRTEAGAMLALVLVPAGKAAATVAKCGSVGGKNALMQTKNLSRIGPKDAKSILSEWDKATFGNKTKSIAYHWEKHGKPYGKSVSEYARDALKYYQENKTRAVEIELNDGRTGLKIPGNPGGIYTTDGKVVSFWYE